MEPSIRRDRSLLGDCAVYLLSALDRGQNDINRPEEGSKAGTARCPASVTDALQFLNNGVDIVGHLNPRGIESKCRCANSPSTVPETKMLAIGEGVQLGLGPVWPPGSVGSIGRLPVIPGVGT
jgi:hypothetical protein